MALKLRKNRSPAPPRNCPLTACMSVIGGAWTPNVIWSLRAGPRRFGELEVDIAPISAKVLTTRLRQLEARGIVRRRPMPTSPPSVEYALTELGARLLPAIEAIAAVGHEIKARLSTGADEGDTAEAAPAAPADSPNATA